MFLWQYSTPEIICFHKFEKLRNQNLLSMQDGSNNKKIVLIDFYENLNNYHNTTNEAATQKKYPSAG